MADLLCTLNPGSGLTSLKLRFQKQEQKARVYQRPSEIWKQHKFRRGDLKCKARSSDPTYKEKGDYVPLRTLIWRAIKLPIYSVALVPLTIGGGAAYLQTSMFSARRFFILLASSVLIISWLNLTNDVYDFNTGADKYKKESVVNLSGRNDVYDFNTGTEISSEKSHNLTGSHFGTLVAAYLFLALGFMGLTWTSIDVGNIRPILLLACAIICGYIYQCPPFRLSYQGLGEPLCFAAFGPFATNAFYLLQTSTRGNNHLPLTKTILSASLLVGFTTTLILFCSHFHQIEEDKAVEKMSPLVRFGSERSASIVKLAVISLYVLVFVFGLTKCLPFSSLVLCGLTFPVGKLVVSFVEENYKDKQKIFMAKYYCVRLHTVFGVALAAGLVLARLMGNGLIPVLTL